MSVRATRTALLAAVVAVATLVAPLPAAAQSEKALHVAFPIAETGFDPQAAGDIYSAMVNRVIFDSLYKHLKNAKKGLLGTEAIKWNFTKFLVDRKGGVIARYAPNDAPESIAGDIEKALS